MLANPNARENMRMDMDVLAESGTEPPTRVPSPRGPEPSKPANDLFGAGGLFGNFDLGSRLNTSAISDTPEISPGASPSPGTPAEPVVAQAVVAEPEPEPEPEPVPEKTVNGGKHVTIAEPEPLVQEPAPVAEPAPPTPPRKVGNLMKELRNDVQQGAMEFNMDSFF
jgi:hypothetical protein